MSDDFYLTLINDLRRRVEALELATKREATTATHRRPSSGAMRLELEKADTQPSPAPTEAGEAFRSATEKLGG